MPVRKGFARWNGDLTKGNGRLTVESGALDAEYSASSRFAQGTGTNPEELIGAAHAGCFSMALAKGLSEAGYQPQGIRTAAQVTITHAKQGSAITEIALETEAEVGGEIANEQFQDIAEDAKAHCPVSQLLKGASISLRARLLAAAKH
jgi:lipoyl-dependent peroxiredoxin